MQRNYRSPWRFHGRTGVSRTMRESVWWHKLVAVKAAHGRSVERAAKAMNAGSLSTEVSEAVGARPFLGFLRFYEAKLIYAPGFTTTSARSTFPEWTRRLTFPRPPRHARAGEIIVLERCFCDRTLSIGR